MIKQILTASITASAMTIAAPAMAAPIIGGNVVVANNGNVIATYIGSDASYTSYLGLVGSESLYPIFINHSSPVGSTVDLGYFTAGTVLQFYLYVADTGDTFYTGPASGNPDGVAHAAIETIGGITTVGWEDKLGGGDRDYNDHIFSFTNTGSDVPEPAAWMMMILGFGLAGAALRRSRVRNVSVSYS